MKMMPHTSSKSLMVLLYIPSVSPKGQECSHITPEIQIACEVGFTVCDLSICTWPCTWKDQVLGLMLCGCILKLLIIVEWGILHFPLALGSALYIAVAGWIKSLTQIIKVSPNVWDSSLTSHLWKTDQGQEQLWQFFHFSCFCTSSPYPRLPSLHLHRSFSSFTPS